MNPEPPVPSYSPFSHLRPELWERSKIAHIVLFVVGTLLMIPAVYALIAVAIFMTMWGSFNSMLDGQEILGFVTGMASTCTGGLAWCSLGLLFFKRADARWQRFCWAVCSVFGFVAAPSTVGWWIYAASEFPTPSEEPDILWAHGIFLLLFIIAVICAALGLRYARHAGKELRSIPEDPRIDAR